MKSISFVRWGNLNPVKHKEHSKKEGFHVAPKKKGIYAFPCGYVERFLIWGSYTDHWNRYIVDDNGNKYSHIINPATGKPEKSDILSATVVATDCATADAYATAFMVTGSEQAKQILAHSPELAVFFILSGDSLDFKYYMNESFHRLIAP